MAITKTTRLRRVMETDFYQIVIWHSTIYHGKMKFVVFINAFEPFCFWNFTLVVDKMLVTLFIFFHPPIGIIVHSINFFFNNRQ